MNLHWTSDVNLSANHAAWCVIHHPQRTLHLAKDLRAAAAELGAWVDKFDFPRLRFWDQLFTLSATIDTGQPLAERLSKRVGFSTPLQIAGLATHLKSCRRQFQLAFPQYSTEISLRTGPLRQMWDGNGAGLLRQIGLLTGEQLVVEESHVVLVQPILGGMGYAHLATNRIHLEALLTHANPQLPEVLRMAWLLSQLDLERPVYSELINAHRLRSVAGLAMLPVVLAAGQALELCTYSPQLISQALAEWHVHALELDPAAAAAVVTTWWETFEHSRPAWRVALTGLDQMLQ